MSSNSIPLEVIRTPLKMRTLLYYPLLVWILGALFFYYKYLLQVSFSVMTAELMQEFNLTATGLGYLDAFYFWIYLFMQIPVGILLDHFSPRKLTTAAILLSSCGALLFAHAHHLYMACFARALIGLGVSFAAVSCLKMMTLWFSPKRFPLMAGFLMTAAMLGAMTANYPLAVLIEKVGSWREAMVVLAAVGGCLAIVYFFLVRDGDREEEGKPKPSLIEQRFGFRGLREVLMNKQTWLLSLYSGLAFAPVSVFGGLWGVPFLMTVHHFTKAEAATETMIIFFGFAIGCPIGGWLVGLLKQNRLVMGTGTFLALLSLGIAIYFPTNSLWILRIALFFFGFCASFFMTSFTVIKQVNRLTLAATAIGFMNMFQSVVEALSMPLVGLLLDFGWQGQLSQGIRAYPVETYHWALTLFPLYLIVALIILSFVKETFLEQRL